MRCVLIFCNDLWAFLNSNSSLCRAGRGISELLVTTVCNSSLGITSLLDNALPSWSPELHPEIFVHRKIAQGDFPARDAEPVAVVKHFEDLVDDKERLGVRAPEHGGTEGNTVMEGVLNMWPYDIEHVR